MPDGFYRANKSMGLNETGALIEIVFNAHPLQPGKNQGGVNNYVVDPTSDNLNTSGCVGYQNFVKEKVLPLYPNPTGALRDALNVNLNNFYLPQKGTGCEQIFPFGQWGSLESCNFCLLIGQILVPLPFALTYYLLSLVVFIELLILDYYLVASIWYFNFLINLLSCP